MIAEMVMLINIIIYKYLQHSKKKLNEISLNGGKTIFVSNLQNYASNYNVLFVKQFLAEDLTLMIQHP